MDNQSLKKTPLYEQHVQLGAKIVDFAGWLMPVQYSNLIEEHNTVRNNVGIFDVSHMGTFRIQGSGAFDYLQKMVPNDLGRISKGKAIYTQFLKRDGGVIDDLIIYHTGDNDFHMVVNASNVEKDFNWLQENLPAENVSLENKAPETAVLAVQGPMAEKTLAKLCSEDLSQLPSFSLVKTTVGGVPDVIVSRTGYTGEDGFELIFANKNAETVFKQVMEAGKEFGIRPIGLGARDTLRLESNLALYGHELDEETNPLEARLAWSVKLEKGDFIGRDALIKQKEQGLKKKLIGLKSTSRAVPREGYEVASEGEILGKITSGTFSPTFNYPIALAYVNTKREYKTGDILDVIIRGKNQTAEIVSLPFYKRDRSK